MALYSTAIASISAGTAMATGPGPVVFSNSPTVSFGIAGQTITASGAGGGGGGAALSAGTQSVSTGTVVFSNSNGITFGMSGSSRITASHDGLTGVTAVRELAAGTQSNSSGSVVFSNSNGISFGMSGSTRVTASHDGLTGVTAVRELAAGTQSNSSGSVVFSNSNGVSFGMSGSTRITASHDGLTAAVQGVGASSVAGIGYVTAGSVVFSNSNGVTFGINASTITASVAGGAGIASISAGTTRVTSGEAVFSNQNGVSFGVDGQTVTASVAAAPGAATVSLYDNMRAIGTVSGAIGGLAFTNSHRSLFVAGLHPGDNIMPANFTANTAYWNVSQSGSTATMSTPFTSHFYIGIYTSTAASLSLLNSVSVSWGFAAGATNNSTAFAGQRFITIHSSAWSSTPSFVAGSQYWIGYFWSSSSRLNQSCSVHGAFVYSSLQRSGTVGVNATATSQGWAPFYGIYASTTGALPAAIQNSQLNKVNANAGFVPHFAAVMHTAVSSF